MPRALTTWSLKFKIPRPRQVAETDRTRAAMTGHGSQGARSQALSAIIETGTESYGLRTTKGKPRRG